MIKQNSASNFLISDIDKIDVQIIKLLIKGDYNKEISSKLKIPLSTIQRRTKKIMDDDLVTISRHLNRVKFGYHTGLIHVYSSDGDINEEAKKVLALEGVTSVEIHIGNSDILAEFAYKDSKDLLDVISKIKKIQGVERVIWSERIIRLEDKNDDLLFKD
jgi:DNA-binding Lrp family transcriptional regulator